MKILLFLHELALGGTTVNAIDLATRLRDRYGHQVVVFGTPGTAIDMVRNSGLEFVAAPHATMHPSLARVNALRQLIQSVRPDLVYVWETWAMTDAYLATHLWPRIPLLLTDMQMFVGRLIPRHVQTTFGTPSLVAQAQRSGVKNVALMLPPVDLELNNPHAVNARLARERLGIADHEIALVIVSRLAQSMKSEGLRHAIDAVGMLGDRIPLRLAIVGDGAARQSLEARAAEVNTALGRRAVVLRGAMIDPRAAYAAADIVIGMGSSALRGMAFGKPVIVVGENGFAKVMEPETADEFYYEGMFGNGRGTGCADLQSAIQRLASSVSLRDVLSRFSLEFVRDRFSLEIVGKHLEQIIQGAVRAPRSHAVLMLAETTRLACVYLRERRFLWRTGPPEAFQVAVGPQT
jgi:L-malate glycosyltransferase